jgi:hypothetical protein
MFESLLASRSQVVAANFTSLLLHADGANGSTNIVDVYGHPMTASNGAALSTVQARFGGSSLLPTGANAMVTTPNAADLQFNADCTMEAWCYLTTVANDTVFIEKSPDMNQVNRCWIEFYQRKIYLKLAGNAGQAQLLVNDILVTGQWFHFAVTRSGNTWSAWYNGALVGSFVSSQTFGVNTGPLIIGNVQNGNGTFPGYMDEVRLSKGKALYTSAFTPQATPFTS